jgi:hypothetical protein
VIIHSNDESTLAGKSAQFYFYLTITALIGR